MTGKKGKCTRCNKFTFNSKSGLCRKCWEKRAWGKDQENIRIYPNGDVDGEPLNTKLIR